MKRVWISLAAQTAFLLLCPMQVRAEEEVVQIGIRIIYAAKDATKSIDPALSDIRSELEELPFSKFRLLDHLESDVNMKSTVELQLPGNQSIFVSALGIDTSKGKTMLALQLQIKPAFKIEMRVTNGGRTLLLGPAHLEGNLILDISAKLKEKPQ
jgi:hypothetical protein